MSDLEKITIDCEFLIGLRACAHMVLGENLLKNGFNVGSCVRRLKFIFVWIKQCYFVAFFRSTLESHIPKIGTSL